MRSKAIISIHSICTQLKALISMSSGKKVKWVKGQNTQTQCFERNTQVSLISSGSSCHSNCKRFMFIPVESSQSPGATTNETFNWLFKVFPKTDCNVDWRPFGDLGLTSLFSTNIFFMLSFAIQFNGHYMKWPLICALETFISQMFCFNFRVAFYFNLTVNWIRFTFER